MENEKSSYIDAHTEIDDFRILKSTQAPKMIKTSFLFLYHCHIHI